MNSSHFFTNNICTVSIVPDDIYIKSFGIELLNLFKNHDTTQVVFDLALFDTITSSDIKVIGLLIDMFKLNNIKVIVCGINPYSASMIFHFIDEINFQTSLDVQSALDEFNNN